MGKMKKSKLMKGLFVGIIAQLALIIFAVLLPAILLLSLFSNLNIGSSETIQKVSSEELEAKRVNGIDEISEENVVMDLDWAASLDDDFYEDTKLTPETLTQLMKSERDSYASEVRPITVTYIVYKEVLVEENVEVKTKDKKGKEIKEIKKTSYYKMVTEEKERTENFDIRQLTYKYRVPWQLIYAMAMTIEEEDEISEDTIIFVSNSFQPSYKYIYDYYNNYQRKFTYSELAGLPHRGSNNNYSPIGILSTVETLFYDYKVEVKTSTTGGVSHEMGEITMVPRPDRFLRITEKLGLDDEGIEEFISNLEELGGFELLIEDIKTNLDIK